MSMFDRIKGQLLLEMTDLEEFLDNPDLKANQLKTQEIIVRYQLNGKDKFIILGYSEITQLMRERAASLRREIVDAPIVDTNK